MGHPESDLARVARTYRPWSHALFAALPDDPFYATMQAHAAGPDGGAEAMLCYYDYSIYEAERFGHLCQPDPDPFGVSVWSVPLDAETAAQKSRDKHDLIRTAMGADCLQVYNDINANMAAGTGPLVDADDWYLSILGVLPQHQGQGRGGDLIRPVLAQTDAAGVATYLETFTPRNMSFYERLGYRAAGQFREPVTNSDYWLMRRPPFQIC